MWEGWRKIWGEGEGRREGVSWRARVPKTRNDDSATGRRAKADGGFGVDFIFFNDVWLLVESWARIQ